MLKSYCVGERMREITVALQLRVPYALMLDTEIRLQEENHGRGMLFAACSRWEVVMTAPSSILSSSLLSRHSLWENPISYPASISLEQLEVGSRNKYLSPASMVSLVLRPCSFSSRLMRVEAAERPMNRANTGSATLEMR